MVDSVAPMSALRGAAAAADSRDTAPLTRAGAAAPGVRRLADLAALAFLVAAATLVLWRVVALGETLLPADVLQIAEPWRSERPSAPHELWNPMTTDALWHAYPHAMETSRAWRRGLPLWDPYTFAGMPALAAGSMWAHPPYRLLDLVLSSRRAYDLSLYAGVLLALVGTYLLVRELGAGVGGAVVGALAFGLNGYLVGWLFLPQLAATAAFGPWVLLGIERALHRDGRWTLFAGVAFGLQTLSGYALFAAHFASAVSLRGGAAAIAAAARPLRSARAVLRPLLLTAAALTLGLALAAFQFVPTLELFGETARGAKIGATSFLRPHVALRLLAPKISGDGVRGDLYTGPVNYIETGIYFGVLPLLTMAAALLREHRRRAWPYLAIALLTLLAVYGMPPARQLVDLAFPLFLNSFPGRIFVVTSCFGAVAAGLGVDALARNRSAAARWAVLAGGASVGLLGLWLVATAESGSAAGGLVERLRRLPHPEGLAMASLLAGVVGALLLARARGWLSAGGFGALAAVVAAVDLVGAGHGFHRSFPAARLYPETPSLRALRRAADESPVPARVLPIHGMWILPGSSNQLFPVAAVTGYTSSVPERWRRYAEATGRLAAGNVNQVYFVGCCGPLFDAAGVRYLYVQPGFTVAATGDGRDLLGQLPDAPFEGAIRPFATQWTLGERALPVLYEHPPARVSFALTPRLGDRFEAQLAIDPGAWAAAGDGVEFAVRVDPAGEAPPVAVASRYVDAKHRPQDRSWLPLRVDLAPWAGQAITLELVTSPGESGDEAFDWAGWGAPRIVGTGAGRMHLLRDGPSRIYENRNALPRAWVVHETVSVAPEALDTVQQLLRRPDFRPAQVAVVESEQALALDRVEGSTAKVVAWRPGRVQVEVRARGRGLLVVSEGWDRGWRAAVDGRPARLHPTDLTFLGVAIPAGLHRVDLEYRPRSFLVGSWVTALSSLLVVVMLVTGRGKPKPPPAVG